MNAEGFDIETYDNWDTLVSVRLEDSGSVPILGGSWSLFCKLREACNLHYDDWVRDHDIPDTFKEAFPE